MRSILIDWLIDVDHKFEMKNPDTIHLTVNLIDRYLENVETRRDHLQLVGITAMHVAAKYHEIYPPQIDDLIHVTDNAYRKQQLLDTEGKML
jgi:cyclin B